jgi:hypothetical protein
VCCALCELCESVLALGWCEYFPFPLVTVAVGVVGVSAFTTLRT